MKDLTNKKFGRLLALEKTKLNNQTFWACKCDCGKQINVLTANLTCNRVKSCGCLKIDKFIERSTIHNQRHTLLYEIWKGIKQRCLNPNNRSYKNYGGRGITICDDWKNDYTLFYNWSIQNGYKKGLSIDRINNNGNYEPSNCRWVNKEIQANNTRSNKYITINGITKSLSDWLKDYDISFTIYYRRTKIYNWSSIQAITTPKGIYNLSNEAL